MAEQEPRKLALMIGVNKYQKLGRRFQLKGCVNDQKMLKGIILERFGFEEKNIQTLFDEQATRNNILRGLDRLAGMGEYEGNPLVQEGDFVMISYSGHGSRLKEPPDQRDEVDGYDSTVVPYNSDRRRPSGKGGPNLDITDDELHERFLKIQERAGHLLLYFDCCHSGTMSRDLAGELARSLEDDDRYDGVDRGPQNNSRMLPTGPSGWLPLSDGYILIAGCADDELSREYKDPITKQPCGALTYHMLQEMARCEGQLTYRDVFEKAKANVSRLFRSQHPQMEGDWNRKLFETKEVLVEPFSKIRVRNKRFVELQVGAVHGTTVNSLWEIRGEGLEDREVLANVIVRSVKQMTSMAEITVSVPEEMEWSDFLAQQEALSQNLTLPARVNSNCRAIKVVHALGDQRLPVGVIGPDSIQTDQLRAQVESSAVVKLVSNLEDAQILAALIEPREGDALDDPDCIAPELGEIYEPTWVIAGRDRAMMPTPPHTIDEEDVVELTLSNLETWTRYFNIHKVRPVGKELLEGKFTVELFASPEDNDNWQYAKPLPIHEETGLPLVEDGQPVMLKLTNTYSKPLYFAIFSMDLMGGIDLLYPPSGAIEPLGPGDDFPLDLGEITLPDTFPEMLEGGLETFKIMVTTKYVNFDVLVQGRSKEVDENGEEIEQEIEQEIGEHDATDWLIGASRGASMASVRPLRKKVDEDAWTVVQIDYYLEAGGGGGLGW